MATTVDKLASQAKYFVGFNEENGGHEVIIDLYNQYRFFGCGYYMKYTGEWCAAFVSACAIKCKATDIIPVECHCNHMISSFKNLGVWIENESIIPEIGDIVFYDWDDDCNGDNVGSSDHVGIVEEIDYELEKFTVIEGNYRKAVQRRTLDFNNKCLRGFARPNYTDKNTTNIDIMNIKLKSFINKFITFAHRVFKKVNSINREDVV